ncbi:zinc finger protein RFP-like [Anolis sagrei]|uniref:zinc finger protein RFP-like n=1 Tax=Anolis sagrei TaxID=38937 RepID=UPI003521E9F4
MADLFAAWGPMEDLLEEATCPICLEYFKDPVSLECGHNFCQACLTQCWEKPGGTETSCPLCREKVLQRKLRINKQLASVIEITKKLSLQGSRREKGKERVCEEHQEPLKLFCKDDEASICVVCDRSKEHRNHTVIPMVEAAQDYKDLMVIHQDNLEKEKENILLYKAETEKEVQDLLKQTKAEMKETLDEITQLRLYLEEREKRLRALMEELEKQMTRERDERLVLFSEEVSSLESLIQEMKEKSQQPPAELLQDVKSLLLRSEKKEMVEKSVAFPSELIWKIRVFRDLNSRLAAVIKQSQGALLSVLELQRANVTLDPDTAGCRLILSEDQKSVRYQAKRQDLPDNPERFRNRAYVLGREGFTSGRHFWDIVVEGEEDWAVGVARKSVRRKGSVNFGPSEGIWVMGKWEGKYNATSLHSSSDFLLSKKTKRVRVCLNYASNQVAFYDADTGDQICLLSDVPFSGETVLPFFYVHKEGHLRISP